MHDSGSKNQNAPADRDGPRDPSPVHSEVRYQSSDVELKWVFFALALILTSFIVVGLVDWWLLESARLATGESPHEADYSQTGAPLPAEPRLESLDGKPGRVTEVFARQIKLEAELSDYGKASEDGFVRVPIPEAIEVAASELQGRDSMPNSFNKGYGLVNEGDANSGRLYREAPSWFDQ